jgi:hypothetical protein
MFHVEWLETALDDLANLWTQADSNQRQGITSATHLLEQRLSSDPMRDSESRAEGHRITFVPPLAIRFQIDNERNSVTVLHVRLFGRRRKSD